MNPPSTSSADVPLRAMPCDGAAASSEARKVSHPLGPRISVVRLKRPIVGRLYAGAVAAGAAALLIVAAGLTPSATHMGTHRQLGLGACGFVTVTGLPCATCGMTTAYAYTIRGQFIEAMRSQVAGFVLAVATVITAVAAAVGTVTGRVPAINWYRVNALHCVWAGLALFMAAWAFKVLYGLADGSAR